VWAVVSKLVRLGNIRRAALAVAKVRVLLVAELAELVESAVVVEVGSC
jgi:hypothetical protein